MGATADRSPAPTVSAPDRPTDLIAAWRLAYVVIGDQTLATEATTRAFGQLAEAHPDSDPSRRDLMAVTLRAGLRAAAAAPGVAPEQVAGSAVITAMWQLPPNQRAALWLTQVDELEDEELGAVFGLSPENAEHVAKRAAGWLDVALDHGSGPLCRHEPKLRQFLDGKLPMVEAAEIDDHLPGCPTCLSKVNAFEELADLPVVLLTAVPDPPATLNVAALSQQAPTLPPLDDSGTVGPVGRPPAVRPLALCCAALLALGLLGATIVRPAHTATDPVKTNDAQPGVTQVVPTGGVADTGGTVFVAPTPTASTTSTTLQPAVTFPTVPHR